MNCWDCKANACCLLQMKNMNPTEAKTISGVLASVNSALQSCDANSLLNLNASDLKALWKVKSLQVQFEQMKRDLSELAKLRPDLSPLQIAIWRAVHTEVCFSQILRPLNQSYLNPLCHHATASSGIMLGNSTCSLSGVRCLLHWIYHRLQTTTFKESWLETLCNSLFIYCGHSFSIFLKLCL